MRAPGNLPGNLIALATLGLITTPLSAQTTPTGQTKLAQPQAAPAHGPTLSHDKVNIGPPPAWVEVVPPGKANADSGSIDLRLVDIQMRADAQGVHEYVRRVMAVKSPAALQALGNISVSWQPAFGSVVVHDIHIMRDGKIIDVLGDGKKFNVLRRESQLETALQFNGVLTAVLPVSDLRVGDELDFSYTINRQNPAIGKNIEGVDAIGGPITFDRAHFLFSWPKSIPLKIRFGQGWPKPGHSGAHGIERYSIDTTNMTPPDILAGAPGRFIDRALVQYSTFANWAAVSNLLTPLFEKAMVLRADSPLKAEIAKIAAANADPMARANAALRLVQGDVRYFADVRGLAGYEPASADAVWAARNGDCKGKTVLLTALLRGLGIDAVPALVSATRGDGVDQALPMPGRFDHVIVMTKIGGKTYWLDGTRQPGGPIVRQDPPNFKWALPLKPGSSALVPIPYAGPSQPLVEWRLDLDARKGLDKPAKATGTGIFRGDTASRFAGLLGMVDQRKRDDTLRNIWSKRHDWVKIDSVSYQRDPKTGVVRIGFVGTGDMDWHDSGNSPADRYEANKARLGIDLSPDRPDSADKAIPVEVDPRYSVTHQTILLPDDGKGFSIDGEAFDQAIGKVQYKRTVSLKGDRFDVSATTRSAGGELTVEQAKAADKKTDDLFAKQLFIDMPTADSAAGGNDGSSPPEIPTAQAIAEVGRAIFAPIDVGKADGAIFRADAAIKAHSRSAAALAMRAQAKAPKGGMVEANEDADHAPAVDGRRPGALGTKTHLLSNANRDEDALIRADQLVVAQPEQASSYVSRGALREQLKWNEAALSDYQIALQLDPTNEQGNIKRANLLQDMGRTEAALKAVNAFVKIAPDNPGAHNILAEIDFRQGRMKEGAAALVRSIAIAPSVKAYQLRLKWLDAGKPDEELVDMIAIIKEAPNAYVRMILLKPILRDKARLAKVRAAYAAADTTGLSADQLARFELAKARVEAALGNPQPMLAASDALVALHPHSAQELNAACWQRATVGVGLDKALEQCNAALAIDHNPNALDSRALVYLRKGDLKAALKDYDDALAVKHDRPTSLFGRGLVKLRLGDKAGSAADLVAARAADKTIDAQFAAYGLKP